MLDILTKFTNTTIHNADPCNQTQFYQKLTKDLKKARTEVINGLFVDCKECINDEHAILDKKYNKLVQLKCTI